MRGPWWVCLAISVCVKIAYFMTAPLGISDISRRVRMGKDRNEYKPLIS